MKPQLPAARWVRPENYHLTVKYLGEREAGFPEEIAAALRPVVSEISQWTGCLGAAGLFPGRGSPKVLWIGWSDGGQLEELVRKVHDVLWRRLELVSDAARYHAHLTVARCRRPWPREAAELWRTSIEADLGESMSIDRVTLYRSYLQPAGPRYEVLEEFPVGLKGG